MLYHKDVYLPPVELPQGTFKLQYSQHARSEAIRDRYGWIPLPHSLTTHHAEVIEVELREHRVHKVVYRQHLDDNRDICIVVLVDRWFVKTVWVNQKNDKHRTLDRSKYLTHYHPL